MTEFKLFYELSESCVTNILGMTHSVPHSRAECHCRLKSSKRLASVTGL